MAPVGNGEIGSAELNRRFGQAVRNARKRARLTQRELAEKVRLERTSISNIEVGIQTVTLPTLIQLCEALNVPISELVETNSAESAGLKSVSGKYARQAEVLLKRDLHGDG